MSDSVRSLSALRRPCRDVGRAIPPDGVHLLISAECGVHI